MATNRNDIGTKFETGDVPSQADFKEIFDNFVHKEDDKATIEMVEEGIDDERYITPALLRMGLQNAGVISGGGNLPYKQHEDNFEGTFINLEWPPIQSSVKVFKNGQLLLEGEVEVEADYYIDYGTATVIFSTPVEGRNIEIDYWYKSNEPDGGLGNAPFKTGLTGLATVIWSGEGLKYYINFPNYYINSVLKSGGSTEVILEPTTSMTNPEKRFDLIYLDINGVKKITGEASESPILPTIDESIAISLSSILLSAGDIIPTSSEDKRVQVYDENVGGEWSVWKEGAVSFNPNYTGDKFKGTKSIQLVNYGSGTEYLKFGSTSGTKSVLDYDTLSFRIKTLSKGRRNENHPAWPFDILLYQIGGPGFDSATKLELRHNRFGYYQDMYIWHLVTIPLNSFITNNVFFDEIIFRRGGGDMDLLIDDVVLVKKETSTVIQTNNQNAITRIITDNGVAAATSANDTIEIKGTNGIKVENTGKKITIDGSGISGGSGDLQSVLEQGNTANNTSIMFSNGTGEGQRFSELNGTRLQMGTSSDGASVEYNAIEVRETYSENLSVMTANGFQIAKLAQYGFDKDIVFRMNPDTPSNSSINLLSPNKTSGTYTIATTSDFKTINGESIVGIGDIVVSGTDNVGENYVKLTGNQTVAGIKVFSDISVDNPYSSAISFKVSGSGVAAFNFNNTFTQFNSFASFGYLFKNPSLNNVLSISNSGNGVFLGSLTASSIIKLGGTSSEYLMADGSTKTTPYKVYTALLSQSGTSAPVATVLENELAGNIIWTRLGTGSYNGTLTGAFTLNKTMVIISNGWQNSTIVTRAGVSFPNFVAVSTYQSGNLTDGLLDNSTTSIEIRVYNYVDYE